MKTNTDLVKHCEIMLKEKWFYLMGTFGQKATRAVFDETCSRLPGNIDKWEYVKPAIGVSRFCDCYGLVKSFLWWAGDAANPKYNASQDRNSTMAFLAAKEKEPLAALPEIPGVVLFMKGSAGIDHAGVYAGGGRFVECSGGRGVTEGLIQGGQVVKGNKFTHWFKDTFITYADARSPEEITADNALADGLITDRAYWLDVLNGKIFADAKFVKTVLDRAHAQINN